MSDSIDVHGLPAKWRQEADDDLDSVTSWKLARRRCADELEAALRQSGEAVDLGQFREAVVSWRSLYHGCTPEADERHSEADRLLAIIDGAKAVSPPATSGLVDALRAAHRHIDMDALRVSHCKDAALIDAALAVHDASIGK